jgi:hypothetical protein
MSGESSDEALEFAKVPKNKAQPSITEIFCMAFSRQAQKLQI